MRTDTIWTGEKKECWWAQKDALGRAFSFVSLSRTLFCGELGEGAGMDDVSPIASFVPAFISSIFLTCLVSFHPFSLLELACPRS